MLTIGDQIITFKNWNSLVMTKTSFEYVNNWLIKINLNCFRYNQAILTRLILFIWDKSIIF